MNKGELISTMQMYCPGAQHTKIRDTKGILQPSWRFIQFKNSTSDSQTKLLPKVVPSVPSVPLGDISSAKIEENKKKSSSFENAKSIKELQGSGTKSTDGTNLRKTLLRNLILNIYRQTTCISVMGTVVLWKLCLLWTEISFVRAILILIGRVVMKMGLT